MTSFFPRLGRPLADAPRTHATAALGTAGLATLLLGLTMAIVDFFIVNIALPDIATSLDTSTAMLELVVAGYGTSYAVLLVPGGRLGDRFGRRRIFLAGVAGFTVASALCGLAPDPTVLVAARVVQGACSALLVPQVLATIQASLSGAERQRALALYGAALGAGAVIGQLLGGLIVQADLAGLGWRPIFLVNLPVGIVTLLAGTRYAPESRGAATARMDVRGAALVGAAIVSILVPVTLGRESGWPAWSLAMLVVAPIALAFALRHGRRLELAGREPLLPPSLLRLPGLRAGLGVVVAQFVAAGGFFLTIALTLQDGLGFRPLEAALTMAPFAVAFLVMSLAGRPIADRIGSRIVRLGGAVYVVGMAGMALMAAEAMTAGAGLNGWILAPALAMIGLGQGAVVAPLIGIAMAGVPAHRAGAASGLLTTTIQASLAIGAAVIGLLFLAVLGRTGGELGPGIGHAAAAHAAAAAAAAEALLGLGIVWQAGRLPWRAAVTTTEVMAR